ncbi:MAG: hypothetical protein HY912_03225 [Desulfomonile tiedjei]|uniref:Uncharacterized protein n=1 Tax=Desulfomonile tiedjei TaxID=2358 RepID=A0A9D6V0K3_9BACT|nr:hypothetical protein [Desulfomonile tiedjei]
MKSLITLDGREYEVEVHRQVAISPDSPRLVVVSNLRNSSAVSLLDACLDSIERFTPEPHEVWVIDNNSPRGNVRRLLERPEINVALNRTEPLPPEARAQDVSCPPDQLNWGRYANAVGLELAARLIDPATRYFMSMHMDTLVCRSGWMSFLKGKLRNGTAAAGVRMDRTRTPEGVLHVLGYMVDFALFQELNLDFFPQLPEFDVGDLVTVKLREAGFGVFACPNTVWEPDLVQGIPDCSPLKTLHVDRAFDDDGNVIFLHLGRGIRRSTGEHRNGTSVEEWLLVAENLISASGQS